MSKEQFEREVRYGAAMALAREMLKKGIINEKDYRKIAAFFLGKYLPVIGTLQAGNP